MKVAAPYSLDNRYKDIPDEYNIKYTETASKQKLLDFCELYPTKRINISFNDVDIDYDALSVARKINPRLTVMLEPGQIIEIVELTKRGMRFFFGPNLPCYSLSLLDMMIAQGVTDIYLSDALCYHLANVKAKCQENGIRTRLILNGVSSISPNKGVDPKAPFFFPRDTEELSEYIDVVEFECGDPFDWRKFKVYYDTWIVKNFWYGDLHEIVPDLQLSFPCQNLPPNMTLHKFNCGRRCSLNSPCRRCLILYELANNLQERGYALKREYQGNSKESEV